MIGVIARRELASWFHSPFAWVLLALVQALVAFVFLLHVESYLEVQSDFSGQSDAPGATAFLVPRVFGAGAALLMLVLPVVTMNLVAGERQRGALALLLSAPVSALEIVLGKYLALLVLLSALTATLAVAPLALALLAPIDLGIVASATAGVWLFLAALGAAGLYLSTLARRPAVAAIATLGGAALLVLAGEWASTLTGMVAAIARYPAPTTHLAPFFSGQPGTAGLAFFVLFAGVFIALAVRRFDNERLHN